MTIDINNTSYSSIISTCLVFGLSNQKVET